MKISQFVSFDEYLGLCGSRQINLVPCTIYLAIIIKKYFTKILIQKMNYKKYDIIVGIQKDCFV